MESGQQRVSDVRIVEPLASKQSADTDRCIAFPECYAVRSVAIGLVQVKRAFLHRLARLFDGSYPSVGNVLDECRIGPDRKHQVRVVKREGS